MEILTLTKNGRPGTALRVYVDTLKQQRMQPEVFAFSFQDVTGKQLRVGVPRETMDLQVGVPIAKAMMDLSCQAILHTFHRTNKASERPPEAGTHFLLPAMEMTHAEAFQWACQEPPPADQLGWTMIPLYDKGTWSLLAVEHGGESIDL